MFTGHTLKGFMQNKLDHIVTRHVICSKNAMFNVFQAQEKSKMPSESMQESHMLFCKLYFY